MKQIYNWDNLLPDEVLCHPHKLIRIGTTYVFEDPECNTVRRVSREPEDYQTAKTHLESIRELARAGAPILPPTDHQPIQLTSGQILTSWPKIDTANLDPSELSRTLRKLHQTPVSSNTPLTNWRPGVNIPHRLEKSRELGVPEGLVTTIEKAWEKLSEELPTEYPNTTLIHGDAHPENLGKVEDTVVLIDLDDIAVGPCEVDLAPAVASALKTRDHAYSPDFLEEYGAPYSSETLEKLVRLRHISMVTWLMTLWKVRPDSQKETILRVATLHQKKNPGWTSM